MGQLDSQSVQQHVQNVCVPSRPPKPGLRFLDVEHCLCCLGLEAAYNRVARFPGLQLLQIVVVCIQVAVDFKSRMKTLKSDAKYAVSTHRFFQFFVRTSKTKMTRKKFRSQAKFCLPLVCEHFQKKRDKDWASMFATCALSSWFALFNAAQKIERDLCCWTSLSLSKKKKGERRTRRNCCMPPPWPCIRCASVLIPRLHLQCFGHVVVAMYALVLRRWISGLCVLLPFKFVPVAASRSSSIFSPERLIGIFWVRRRNFFRLL